MKHIGRAAHTVFVVTMILLGCQIVQCQNRTVSNSPSQVMDSTISLLDIKQYTREELADIIQNLSRLRPRVIILEVTFETLKDPIGDSLLSVSLANARNVVFTVQIDDDRLVRSHPLFSQYGVGEGANTYLIDENRIANSYVPLFENDDEQIFSISDEAAFWYNPQKRKPINSYKVNQIKPVKIVLDESNFQILDESNLTLDSVKGRIVILGYLGENDPSECYVYVNGTKRSVHQSVITANLILEYLGKI